MAGWHHRRNEHELGQTPGDGGDREAWRAAVHVVTELDTTRRLNNDNKINRNDGNVWGRGVLYILKWSLNFILKGMKNILRREFIQLIRHLKLFFWQEFRSETEIRETSEEVTLLCS